MSNYPTPNSVPERDQDQSVEPVAKKLERLATAVVTALNTRDFDFTSESGQELVAHLGPTFKAELDSLPNQNRPRTWEEQKLAWKRRVEQYPDVHFEITGIDSLIDERAGKGSVYMNMEVSGLGEGVLLHAMNHLEWRKGTGNHWVCYHIVGMRGSMANSGGIG